MRKSAVEFAAALLFSLAPLLGCGNPAAAQSYSGPIGFSNQAKIVTTGTAVQLPPGKYVNGFVLCADDANNAAGITVGYSSSLNNLTDGTGNGLIRRPGTCVGLSNSDSSQIWINGHAGDIVSLAGN